MFFTGEPINKYFCRDGDDQEYLRLFSRLIGFNFWTIFLISPRLQNLITTKSATKKHIVTQTLTSAQIKYEKNAHKKEKY